MDGDGNIESGDAVCPNLPSFRTLSWDEFVVLGAALKEFNGKLELLLTVTLVANEHDEPSNLNNSLNEELKSIVTKNGEKSGKTKFCEKAIEWAKNKLAMPYEIPKNGLAIFAGVISNGHGRNKTLTRVLIQFEPGFTSIEKSRYNWHLEFLPEYILDSKENAEKHRRYGIISISETSVTMGIFEASTQTIEYCEDPIDFNENPNILMDTLADSANLMYIDHDPRKPRIIGLIVGFAGDLKDEGRRSAECALGSLDAKLLEILGNKAILCDGPGGIAGLKETIAKGTRFLDFFWKVYIHKLARDLWLLPTSQSESESGMDLNGNKKATLIETMRELGIGIVEQIEVVDGCYTKKIYTDYSVK